jgi:hypothetical protein
MIFAGHWSFVIRHSRDANDEWTQYMTVREPAAPARSASEALAGASGWCAAELQTLI